MHIADQSGALAAQRKPFYAQLYVQVLVAITVGILLGHFYPSVGESMKPLGDAFIKLIKMIIAPIVFCVVVLGIAQAGDLKKVGRVGIKAVLYFEVVTGFALLIGVILAYALQPGVGMNIDPSTLDASAMSAYADRVSDVKHGTVDFLMKIIPTTVTDAFAKGDIVLVPTDTAHQFQNVKGEFVIISTHMFMPVEGK